MRPTPGTGSAGDRLLLEGVAHRIRQVWVLLTEQVTGTGEPGWVPQLPLRTRIRWLDTALRDGLLERCEIPLSQTA